MFFWVAGGVAVAGIIYAQINWWRNTKCPTLDYLASSELITLDENNSEIVAKDIWADNGAVIMVVRRPG